MVIYLQKSVLHLFTAFVDEVLDIVDNEYAIRRLGHLHLIDVT